jgi:WD40 repeat protein
MPIYSPDGRRLAQVDPRPNNDSVQVLDWATGETVAAWNIGRTVREIVFSPSGDSLVTVVAEELPIQIWDAATGRQRAVVERQAEYAQTVAFSPNGRLLATSFSDGQKSRVRLWRMP